jgi:hypothetical protein
LRDGLMETDADLEEAAMRAQAGPARSCLFKGSM